jgi:hypothetical protein
MQKFNDRNSLSLDSIDKIEIERKSSLETVKLNFQKRKSEAFIQNFEIGNINYDTPISYFLKTYYKQNLSCYIYHQEISFSKEINYIFVLNDDILITTSFEDENNTEFYNYPTKNPIILKIDYKSVILT